MPARRGAACAEYLPEISKDAKQELLNECESIWKQMEECQSKLQLLGTETLLKSEAKHSLLTMQAKALSAECSEWQQSPEITSANPEVLLALGMEELQKVKNNLEMMLSTAQLKNKRLEEDLKREQQWYDEQQKMLNTLNGIEEETKTQAKELSKTSFNGRLLYEVQTQALKLKMYKEDILNALGDFLSQHFPLPEKGRNAKNSKISSEQPDVELVTLQELLEILINKLMSTPHEPYVAIKDSFWPPYIELLLRYGIAMRHPEDPNRIRLEAFYV
ncbi:centromere protein K isoform X1 [Apus apus]|uniref:centromere protein K isoform X1 n=1 Tax=Apus apus TaxID=8895 RepID=UPI0021F86943|nr:centromere protein K isoform X1 [Apus apus]